MSISLNVALAQSALTSQHHRKVAEILHKNNRGEGIKEGLPTLSAEQIINKSLSQSGFEHSLRPQDGTEVTYAFNGGKNAQSPTFSDTQKNRIRADIEHFSDVAKLKFKESAMASSHHIQLKVDSSRFDWKDPYYVSTKNGAPGGVDVPLLQRHAAELEQPNSYGSHVIAKALAFKLGLPAAGSGGGPRRYHENTLAYTLRSPYSEGRSGQRFGKEHISNAYPSTPMMDDIALLQKKYGANHETRAGDTTYGFNSNTGRETFTLKSDADLPVFCAWDGGGKDTFDFSEFTQNQIINLNQASFSNVGGGVGNVSIAQGVLIERAIGGKGENIIIGNEANNELVGGPSSDILYVNANSGFNKLWGGDGRNIFVIGASEQSAKLENTAIMDFVSGKDKLDLSALRAASNQPNIKVVNKYTGRGGEVTIDYFESHKLSMLRFDINGDGKMDCMVTVTGRIEPRDIIV
ncbi:M10 family metallopeptidase C-terminal domain-containing protein [Pseudomonas sp. 18175]|uniref:M10 family metallopeptidase C-terminal domain-containing protein n=1 Tax=Pseudomonas sp. 18175 TaxID=3390056 RepID=UPI003D248379